MKIKILSDKILQLFNIHAGLVKRKVNKQKAEWFTDCIKIMTKKRNKYLSNISELKMKMIGKNI